MRLAKAKCGQGWHGGVEKRFLKCCCAVEIARSLQVLAQPPEVLVSGLVRRSEKMVEHRLERIGEERRSSVEQALEQDVHRDDDDTEQFQESSPVLH
jgi:hypothetical protein